MPASPSPWRQPISRLVDEWLDFIDNDDLKTTMITLKSVNIMDEIQELSWFAMLQNTPSGAGDYGKK